jgi:ubiquitin-conjugating enzyme E2 O
MFSRLYNEKAYVLSRGFILRALELELGGLNSELRWLYFSNGRLDKVLRDARALIECSEIYLENDRRDVAVPRLTAGGIISLRRVLDKLKSIHNPGDVVGVQ